MDIPEELKYLDGHDSDRILYDALDIKLDQIQLCNETCFFLTEITFEGESPMEADRRKMNRKASKAIKELVLDGKEILEWLKGLKGQKEEKSQ